jgi:flagellar protein FliO/FliZ
LLVAGLLINIHIISAQEEIQEVLPSVEEPTRINERDIILGESPVILQGAGPSIWSVVRMILTLALAAAAIYGIVFILKRASKPAPLTDPFLKVLASSHLGSNRYAHIVSVGNKAWLLGSSDGGVNLIGEIDDKDIINSMLLEDSKKTAETTVPGRDFLALLRRLGASSDKRIPGADDIRRRRERLKEL